jgi:hypothetical protein
MKVYLAQVKCPNNHCVLGGAAEFEEDAQKIEAFGKLVMLEFEWLIKRGALNRKCEICNSTIFGVHVEATGFQTMEEAAPHLAASEAAQLATVQMLRASRN